MGLAKELVSEAAYVKEYPFRKWHKDFKLLDLIVPREDITFLAFLAIEEQGNGSSS